MVGFLVMKYKGYILQWFCYLHVSILCTARKTGRKDWIRLCPSNTTNFLGSAFSFYVLKWETPKRCMLKGYAAGYGMMPFLIRCEISFLMQDMQHLRSVMKLKLLKFHINIRKTTTLNSYSKNKVCPIFLRGFMNIAWVKRGKSTKT